MTTKGLLIAPAVLLASAAQAPDTVTPDGPATLYSDWHGGQTDEGPHPLLLTGFRVVVQPGGKAGTIRFLVYKHPELPSDGPPSVTVGDPVTLPAAPGTYVFPAPHVFADYRDVTYGIEQETGGHAIEVQNQCMPQYGDGDICASESVDVYSPPLGAAVPDRRTASDSQRGRKLTIDPITEPDADGDGAGDETEDRTNLVATGATTTRLSGQRRAFDVTFVNRGPRTADRPVVAADFFPSPGLGTWTPGCGDPTNFNLQTQSDQTIVQPCTIAPLAVGASRTVRLVVPDLGFGEVYFRVSAEGPDLAEGDEDATTAIKGPRPPLTLEIPARLKSVVKIPIVVRSAHAGTVRLKVQRGKGTYTRTLAVHRKRAFMMRVPLKLAREQGLVTVTARLGKASTRARVQETFF
jgi:hypothetical protein